MAISANSTGRWSSSLNNSTFTADQKMEALNHLDHSMTMAVLPVTIFVAIEAVVGFFFNIVVLYVFLFHYKHCNFRLFVLCLCWTELISTMTMMPGEAITQLYWYTYPDPILCKIKSFCNMFTFTAEALALLAITTDRYLKACRPLDRQISLKASRYIVIAIVTVAIIYSILVAIVVDTNGTELVYMGVPVTVKICVIGQKFREIYEQMYFMNSFILGAELVAMFVLCVLIAKRLLCHKTELFSRSTQEPTPKVDAIDASTDNASEQPSNLNSIEIVEEIDASVVSSSDGISDLKTVCLGVEQTAIADDRLSPSAVEYIGVDRKVGKQPETGHVRSKTIIMFVLIVTFIVTTVLYLILVSYAKTGVLLELSDSERATYFFFLRLYFINRVINPIVFGVLDPKVKHVISQCRYFRTRRSN